MGGEKKMKKGLIGKKIGMTQIFNEEGKVIPVTVIEAGPCVAIYIFPSSFLVGSYKRTLVYLVLPIYKPKSHDNLGISA